MCSTEALSDGEYLASITCIPERAQSDKSMYEVGGRIVISLRTQYCRFAPHRIVCHSHSCCCRAPCVSVVALVLQAATWATTWATSLAVRLALRSVSLAMKLSGQVWFMLYRLVSWVSHRAPPFIKSPGSGRDCWYSCFQRSVGATRLSTTTLRCDASAAKRVNMTQTVEDAQHTDVVCHAARDRRWGRVLHCRSATSLIALSSGSA